MAQFPTSKQFFAVKTPGRFYLFLGDEEGEKDKGIAFLSSKLFSGNDEAAAGTSRFYPQGRDLAEFSGAVDFAMSQSMFSVKRLCVIRGVDSIPATDETRELARQLIMRCDDSVTVVMTSNDKKIPAIFSKECAALLHPVMFWKYFDNDLARYIQRALVQNGLSGDERVVARLIERSGNDIKKIDEALDMISRAGITGQLTGVDIDFYVADVSDATVFEFIDYLFAKNKKALLSLRKLLDDGEAELKILALIIRQADQLESCYRHEKEGMHLPGAIEKLKIPPRSVAKFEGFLSKFPLPELSKLYSAIARAERELKGGSYAGFVSNPITVLVSGFL